MDLDKIDHNFNYYPPALEQIGKLRVLREDARDLARSVAHRCPDSREKSLALTKIEEALMWANAAIVREKKETD